MRQEEEIFGFEQKIESKVVRQRRALNFPVWLSEGASLRFFTFAWNWWVSEIVSSSKKLLRPSEEWHTLSWTFYCLCKVIGTSVRWPIHREKAVVWYLDEKSSGSTAEKWIFECLVVSTSISSSDLFILSVSRRKDEDPWFFLLNILLKYRSDN